METCGHDPDAPPPPPPPDEEEHDGPHETISQIYMNLPQHFIDALPVHFEPLQENSNHGVSIYVQVREYLTRALLGVSNDNETA